MVWVRGFRVGFGTALVVIAIGCGAKEVTRLDRSRPDPQGAPRPVLGSRNQIERPLHEYNTKQ